MAKKAALARWGAKATHEGELAIGDVSIQCFVLEDGERVLLRSAMLSSLNLSAGGPGGSKMSADRLTRFVEGKGIGPFLSPSIVEQVRSPIRFRTPTGREAKGYRAEILAEICYAVMNARRARRLQSQQNHIAEACELLMMGFARVGIVALVDEATGYQYQRAREALAKILEDFIAKEQARWVKTFPDEYFIEHARLRNLNFQHNRKAPLAGKDTANIIYQRLAPGVLDELRRKNPARKAKHHQFLTVEHGHPKLREHIASVVTMMKLSNSWNSFLTKLDKIHPKYNSTLYLRGLEEPELD